ncbi:unnamed protein product [Ixodes hexagonus]
MRRRQGTYKTLGSTRKTLKILSNGEASESRRRGSPRSDRDDTPGKPGEEARVLANERAAPRRSARFAQSASFLALVTAFRTASMTSRPWGVHRFGAREK